MCIIKWLLITSWGRVEGLRHGQLSEDILERKMKYAREYLAALDVVDAGISHNRGITLWELQSVNTFLSIISSSTTTKILGLTS